MAYFKIEYYSAKTVGSIPPNYHFWFYIDAEIGEPVEDYFEEGEEDGSKNFVPFFQKSTKKYIMETVLVPEHIIDAIHRLKLFETVNITTPIGDVWEMKNIKTDVNYPFPNKTYGISRIEFDLDESIVLTGC
jgi:hypothetical protein